MHAAVCLKLKNRNFQNCAPTHPHNEWIAQPKQNDQDFFVVCQKINCMTKNEVSSLSREWVVLGAERCPKPSLGFTWGIRLPGYLPRLFCGLRDTRYPHGASLGPVLRCVVVLVCLSCCCRWCVLMLLVLVCVLVLACQLPCWLALCFGGCFAPVPFDIVRPGGVCCCRLLGCAVRWCVSVLLVLFLYRSAYFAAGSFVAVDIVPHWCWLVSRAAVWFLPVPATVLWCLLAFIVLLCFWLSCFRSCCRVVLQYCLLLCRLVSFEAGGILLPMVHALQCWLADRAVGGLGLFLHRVSVVLRWHFPSVHILGPVVCMCVLPVVVLCYVVLPCPGSAMPCGVVLAHPSVFVVSLAFEKT